jgi:DNA-binding transcriptional MerR regulator
MSFIDEIIAALEAESAKRQAELEARREELSAQLAEVDQALRPYRVEAPAEEA